MIGDKLRNYNWDNWINILLGEVSNVVDKRQGGVMYDTLSPAATGLAVAIELMRGVYLDTFAGTAQGEYQDARYIEQGITRIPATNAIRRVYVYDTNGNLIDVPIGTLIAPKGNETLLYSITEKENIGIYKAICTKTGIVGNEYIGECSVMINLTNIGSVMMTDVIESARNEETDEAFRERYIESTGAKPFGGNIPWYRALVGTELANVGQMQVYPRTWGEPVLNSIVLSVVDPSNQPIGQEQLDAIRELLDPSSYPAEGHGIVPIDHHPQVVTPVEALTNVELTIIPESGREVDELRSAVIEKVTKCIEEVRNNWGKINVNYGYDVVLFQSNIIAYVKQVEGVLSVNDVLINNVDDDYIYIETKNLQQIPKVGTITVN